MSKATTLCSLDCNVVMAQRILIEVLDFVKSMREVKSMETRGMPGSLNGASLDTTFIRLTADSQSPTLPRIHLDG